MHAGPMHSPRAARSRGPVRAEERAHVVDEARRAGHRFELHAVRVAVEPTPGGKQLAALPEGGRQLIAEVCTVRSVGALLVPPPQGLALLLRGEARARALAAHVRCRPLQVVEARRGNVEVRLVGPAPDAPRRAAVLLHYHGGPVRMERLCVQHEQALPAAADAAVIGVAAAAAVIGPHDGRERVRCSAREPHLLAVHGPAEISGVLRPVARRRDVLLQAPRLQRRGVAALTAAIPVMRHPHAAAVPRHLAAAAAAARLAAPPAARLAAPPGTRGRCRAPRGRRAAA
mmetsp:Transcript_4615/g.14479  ORF Transcript_4615/g.14479 Transcript_4615/m.14479 type:complete len:287 (-) Transcript_4615:407-1267(-)